MKESLASLLNHIFHEIKKNRNHVSHFKVEEACQKSLPRMTLTQSELDAFKMKAILLSKAKSIPLHLIKTVLERPVEVESKVRENEKVVVRLSQKFECAGKVYQLEGEFLRPSNLAVFSIPVQNSFKLTESKIQ